MLPKTNFRHELKYVLFQKDIYLLENKVKKIAKMDTHVADGGYYVRSLYFDDYFNTHFYEKEAGVDKQKKWRIRKYNNDNGCIKLECKKKERGRTTKDSCHITEKQMAGLVQGILNVSRQYDELLNEFIMQIKTKRYKPEIFVEYFRVPYVISTDNIRITIDKNITSRKYRECLFEWEKRCCDYKAILPSGYQLLEIKYDERLPEYVSHVLALHNLKNISFSKYYLCRKYNQ